MPRVESHMNAAWLWTTIFPFIQYTTALRMLAGFYMGQTPLCYGLQTFPFVQHTMALRELNLHGMDSLISTYGNSILREWHHSNLPSQHNQNANYTHTHTHKMSFLLLLLSMFISILTKHKVTLPFYFPRTFPLPHPLPFPIVHLTVHYPSCSPSPSPHFPIISTSLSIVSVPWA